MPIYPPAYPHQALEQIYPNVYLLHGSIKMGPGMWMNRNMLVLKDDDKLSLINPVRINDEALKSLDMLGKVKHIMRLGDFHGLDDPFYLDKYQCEFWAQAGQGTYTTPKPSHEINTQANSPFPNSDFFIFESARYPEAALLLKEHKLLITTDSIQYHADWSYFSWFTKFVFKLLGFKKGINIGPPWLKRVSPKGGSMKKDFDELLKLDFDGLIAAHGKLLETGAKQHLKNEMLSVFK